jgi:glyoxylase-like metal-dependent hydrolase (beta-lactamase superfamily II)
MLVKEINEHVIRVPLVANWAINCYLIKDSDGSLILIDTGIKGSWRKIDKALRSIGKSPSDVKAIVISHAHLDHVGSLEKAKYYTNGLIYGHEIEKDFISNGKTPQVTHLFFAAKIFSFFSTNIDAVDVDYSFKDEEVLNLAGGLKVIHTPGHTPGHCSFLHLASSTLITGDAVVNFFARLSYPFKYFCSDYKLTKQTAQKLAEFDYDSAVFMHGPPIYQNARVAIGDFLNKELKNV